MTTNVSRKKARRPAKPSKPYPEFPLTANSNGQWSKKVRGKVHYFGVWANPEAAESLWNEQKEDLLAGRKPRSRDGLNVGDLFNRFLGVKAGLVETGEITRRHWLDYRSSAEHALKTIDRNRLVDDLAADDFEKLRVALAKTNGPTRLGNAIQRVRSMFKYAYDAGLIDRPVRFGPTFKRPPKRIRRAARREAGKRLFSAEEIRKTLDTAGAQLKAMVLLAINCGFGQGDISALPLDRLDLDGGWHNYERPKTEVNRRCQLWPETVKALRIAIEKRPTPKSVEDTGLVFVTKYGKRWVRIRERLDENERIMATRIDSVGLEFAKLLRELGIKQSGISFYSLRRTFRTVADGAGDQPAVTFIMGHADDDGDMGAVYRQDISDDRLRRVTDYVHAWLFPKARARRKSSKRSVSK